MGVLDPVTIAAGELLKTGHMPTPSEIKANNDDFLIERLKEVNSKQIWSKSGSRRM